MTLMLAATVGRAYKGRRRLGRSYQAIVLPNNSISTREAMVTASTEKSRAKSLKSKCLLTTTSVATLQRSTPTNQPAHQHLAQVAEDFPLSVAGLLGVLLGVRPDESGANGARDQTQGGAGVPGVAEGRQPGDVKVDWGGFVSIPHLRHCAGGEGPLNGRSSTGHTCQPLCIQKHQYTIGYSQPWNQ